METAAINFDTNRTAEFQERMINLMKEQVTLLNRIDERQAAADLSTQPIPQVAKTSNTVWGPLLRSRISETIEPKVDRWRSGLDVLLVFVGLFSAIVTSFLVASLPGLQQDAPTRTNELLANLTEIIIQLSTGAKASISTLKIVSPAPFEPDAVNVRLNSYWTISLILSLSIAALAVVCRGFLNMVTLSRHVKAVDRLVDINTRWKTAEKLLGPAIESIPQLLVIPVLLFIVGLFDNVFSSILGLQSLSRPLAVTAGLSLLSIAGTVTFVTFAIVHAIVRPDGSPFQSGLSHVLHNMIAIISKLCRKLIIRWKRIFAYKGDSDKKDSEYRRKSKREQQMTWTYHEIVQVTHDDDTLDKAAAGLRASHDFWVDGAFYNTLIHLLSPEASMRSNRTAAQAILDLNLRGYNHRHLESAVLSSLVKTARRSATNRRMATLWTSPYITACAILIGAFHAEHPPVVCILGSGFVADSVHLNWELDHLLAGILLDYLDSRPNGSATTTVQLFEPDFISPQNVLASAARFIEWIDDEKTAFTLISLLMAAKTPAVVIPAACEQIDGERKDIYRLKMGVTVVKAFLVSEASLKEEDSGVLADLCHACILYDTPRGSFDRFFNWVEPVLTGLPSGAASAALGLAQMIREGVKLEINRGTGYEESVSSRGSSRMNVHHVDF